MRRKLSVLFLSFNRLEKLLDTIYDIHDFIHTVEAFSPFDSELIVLDNGSKDEDNVNTLRRLHEEKIIDKLELLDYNSGQAGGLSRLFNLASHEYILVAQNDWQLHDSIDYPFIIQCMDALDKYEDVGMVQLKYKIRGPEHIEKELEPNVYMLKHPQFGQQFGCFSFQIHMTTKNKYNKYGPYEELPMKYDIHKGLSEGPQAEYIYGSQYGQRGFKSAVIKSGQMVKTGVSNESYQYSNVR